MSLLSLFFQTKAKLDMLELDCSISESHEAAAQLSQNEVEDGSVITDNVVLSPLKLTIEGVVSKTPLGLAGLIGSAFSAAAGVAGTAGGAGGARSTAGGLITTGVASLGGLVASAVGADGPNSRAPSDVYDYLLELRNRRIPFDVVTALKLYKNMVLTNVSVPRNKDNVGVLRFSATLEQVKIVTAETVNITSSVGGAGAAAKLGKQATSQASATTSSSSASILSHLTGVGQ